MRALLPPAACLLALSVLAVPTAPQGFLHSPIEGPQKVLYYRLAYPAGIEAPAVAPLPLTTPCEGAVSGARFAEIVEEILENNSYGRLDVQSDVLGTADIPVMMPMPLPLYDTGCADNLIHVLKDARAAAFAQFGVDWSDYDYEVIVTKRFWNQGPQGGGGFNKNFRVSFCGNNGLPLLDLVLHEMGHGFKFEHASYLAGDPTLLVGCLEQYGDKFDIMGQVDNPQVNCERHFHPRHKIWANWYPLIPVPIGTDPIDVVFPTVTQDGTFTILGIEDGTPQDPRPRAIRIPRDAELTYYVTFRRDDPQAQLRCAPGDGPCNGVVVTRARDNNLRPSGNTVLLNPDYASPAGCLGTSAAGCPGAENWCGSVLTKGEAFADPDFLAPGDGMQIEVLDVFADRARVRVTFDNSPAPPIDPLPVIDILSPSAGDLLSGVVPIQIKAWDPDDGNGHFAGLSEITIFAPGVDSVKFTSGNPQGFETFAYDTSLACDGARVFVVEARDAATGKTQRVRFRYLSDNGVVCCESTSG